MRQPGQLPTWQASNSSLEQWLAPSVFRSPQGLATSPDERRLYVSDYRYGIAIIDLATRAVSRLRTRVPVLLDGIDGLWRHGDDLIAVQNGTSPLRIVALELSTDGRSVVGQRVLEQSHPEWIEPLGGTLAQGALVYVGNGQWEQYSKSAADPASGYLPTQIRRLPLD